VNAPRFFSSLPLPRVFSTGTTIDVGDAVARHLQVLRIAAGETITLFDGLGGEFCAVVVDITKRSASVALSAFDPVEREAPIKIALAQSLATADKMDFIVQKSVELGVNAIMPIAATRSTLKLDGERAKKRIQHWQAVAVAACEQCGRNRIPQVHDLQSLETWLSAHEHTNAVLLHPGMERSLLACVDASAPITLLIGPEGGFAPDEIARAMTRGVVPASFGPRTLRTETAGLAAIAAIAARFGDLNGNL
jgi:16S rRNA (uracil1498-N3)-methyltransferase